MLTSDEGYAILRGKEEKRGKRKKKRKRKDKKGRIRKDRRMSYSRKRLKKEQRNLLSQGNQDVNKFQQVFPPPQYQTTLQNCTSSEATHSHNHTPANDTADSTLLPGQENRQDYEYCECFGTFKEDISLGNGAEGPSVPVNNGFM